MSARLVGSAVMVLALSAVGWADALAPPLTETRTTYYVTDAVGSVRGEVSEDGALTATHRYTPFGLAPAEPLPAQETPQFSSQLRLPATGTDDFHARHYQPDAGRFLSADPIRFQTKSLTRPQDFNLYGYALNNPYKYVDPDGRRLPPSSPLATIGDIAFYRGESQELLLRLAPKSLADGITELNVPTDPVVEAWITQAIQEMECYVAVSPLARQLINHPGTVVFVGPGVLSVGDRLAGGVTVTYDLNALSIIPTGLPTGERPNYYVIRHPYDFPENIVLHELVHQAIGEITDSGRPVTYAVDEIIAVMVTDAVITGHWRSWREVFLDMYGASLEDDAIMPLDIGQEVCTVQELQSEVTRVIEWLQLRTRQRRLSPYAVPVD